MKFSCFAPMGLYRLAAGPPEAENIYNGLIANLGDQYNTDIGSRQEATCFAQALGIARANRRTRAAADERLPTKCNETLPNREAAYGLVPGANDTMADRHAALAARVQLPTVCSATVIAATLQALLGTDFVAYKPTSHSATVMYPSSCGAAPMNLQRADAPRKLVQLAGPVSFIGTTVTFNVTIPAIARANFNPKTQSPVAGDIFVFDPGRPGQQDRVTVLSVVANTFLQLWTCTGVFARPHEALSLGVTQPFPYWVSTKKHNLVVVSAAAAADPEKRRKIDEAMRLMVTSSSTWDIVAGTSTQTTLFQLDQPSLDQRTLATVSLP